MGSGYIKGGLYVVMFLNLGVLLILFKKQHVISKGKSAVISLFLSALAIASAVGILKYDGWVSARVRKRISAQERKYQSIGYKLFGQEIAKLHAGKKLLIISQKPFDFTGAEFEPDNNQPSISELQLSSLKEGIGSACTVVAVKEVIPEMGDEIMDYSPKSKFAKRGPILSAKTIDSLMEQYQQVDAIVLLVGLPADYKDMKIWKIKDPQKRPALILANGSPYGLKKAIRRGFISIMLVNNFQANKFDAPVPDDETEAFNARFLLLTSKNLDEIEQKNPKIF